MTHKILAFLRINLTIWDKVLIAFLTLCTIASFSVWVNRTHGDRVAVMIDGRVVKEFALNHNLARIEMRGAEGPFIMEIKGGRVRMVDSVCPAKTCVKMGWIRSAGQMICCIPNRVAIVIKGDREEYDALAR